MSRSLGDQAYEVLRDQIACGELEPGVKLVRRELSERLGVSTITIMDALRRLENDGLVVSRQYSETRVRPITASVLRGDNALREAMESQVARMCAAKADKLDLNRLFYMAGRVDGSMAGREAVSSQQGMKLHMDFHLTLGQMADCGPIYRELERLWYRELMLFSWAASRVQTVPTNWHHDLVKAIASGDKEVADRQARLHVRFGAEEYVRLVMQQEEARHADELKSSDDELAEDKAAVANVTSPAEADVVEKPSSV